MPPAGMAAQLVCPKLSDLRYRPDHARRARLIAAGQAALGEPAFAAAWAEGRALTFEGAVAYALAGGED